MSSSSTINVHLKGEKEKVPLLKITPKPSKAKYNAPLEGRKSLENVASTHRTNNLRNSLSSSKVPIRLESRTGGCSKSNSEVMINENSNKSKGNSKRKIIDHLNSRESHPHGEDKVDAHLSEKKPSRLKRNSAFQINITENISHPRHSRSSSSKEGNEHKKCHGQGRIEAKKMLPCKSILKKFSQSDLHLNNPNLHPGKRKLNFDVRKISNQDGKQSNIRKVTFKTRSTTDLTKESNDNTTLLPLKKANEGELVKQQSSDIDKQSGDHLIQNKTGKIISESLTEENSSCVIILDASPNESHVLNVDPRENNLKENENSFNELKDNKKTNEETKSDISMTENISEVSADIKFPSGNSPNIEKTPVLKTDLLHVDNKSHSESASRRNVIEKEINDRIKFLTEQFKKNMNYNPWPISRSDNNDEDYQKSDECGDYKIDEPHKNASSAFKSSENTFNISGTNIDELNIEDNCNIKKLGRKQLLEREINEKIKRLTDKFKENQSKKAFPGIVVNEEEKLKLTEIECSEEEQMSVNSAPCSKYMEPNQEKGIEEDENKVHKEFSSNLTSSDSFIKNIINLDCEEYNNSQSDLELSSSKSQTSIDEIRLPNFSRIPRPLNYKTSTLSSFLNGQINKVFWEKMPIESKTTLYQDTILVKSPFTRVASPGSRDLNKSPRCSQIPRPLKSKTGMDSPLSFDIKNDTLRKRSKCNSPTNAIVDAGKMKLSSYVLEHKFSGKEFRNENEVNKFNKKSFTVEEFDNLIKDKENIEHLNNSQATNFSKICLNSMQGKKKNNMEQRNEQDMFSSKCEGNSTKHCDENDLKTLQIGEIYCNTEISISEARHSFSRQLKVLFLLGFILFFCVLLLIVLFF